MSAIVTDAETIQRIVAKQVEVAISEILPPLVRRAVLKPYLSQQEVLSLTPLLNNRRLRRMRKKKQVEYIPFGERSFLYRTLSLLEYFDRKRIRVDQVLIPTWSESLCIANKVGGTISSEEERD